MEKHYEELHRESQGPLVEAAGQAQGVIRNDVVGLDTPDRTGGAVPNALLAGEVNRIAPPPFVPWDRSAIPGAGLGLVDSLIREIERLRSENEELRRRTKD